MSPEECLSFLKKIEKLKSNTRHSWTADGTRETVAAHTFGLTALCLLLEPEFPQLDMGKVLRMCVIHDFGEAVTGDIPSFEKSQTDEKTEQQALAALTATLPSPQKEMLSTLYAEMDAMETQEARLYKALDKMEAVIQHNSAPLDSWIPLEYELNLTYGIENAAEFPFLKALRAQVLRETRRKLGLEEENRPASGEG